MTFGVPMPSQSALKRESHGSGSAATGNTKKDCPDAGWSQL
jgi:hypothetical protein